MKKFKLIIYIFVLVPFFFAVAYSNPLSPLDCVKLALQNSHEMAISSINEEISNTLLATAKAGRFLPKLDLRTYGGPVPNVSGDISSASNDDNLSPSDFTEDLGYFLKIDLEILQPIYTFGKIKSYINMAESGVRAEIEAKKHSRLDVSKQILSAYFGILYTVSLQEIIKETREKLNKAENKLDELLKKGDDKISEDDKLKLELYSLELDKNENRIKGERELTTSILKKLINWEENDLPLRDSELYKIETERSVNESFANEVSDQNPQIKMLREGVKAKREYLAIERSDLFPLFYAAGGLKYSLAPGREDQSNPFVNDDFNYFHGGIFFGIEQKLNLWFLSQDYKKAKLEVKKVEKQLLSAEMGINLKAKKILSDISRYTFDIDKNKNSIKIARSLLFKLIDKFENFGDVNIRDITEAFLSYINTRTEYYKSIFAYNIAIFDLSVLLNRNITKEIFFIIY